MKAREAKKSAGVTLVETIVVIAIAALLILTAATMSNSYTKKQAVKDAASAADHFLKDARSRAISLGVDLFINTRYNSVGLSWCLGLTDDPAGCDCRNNTCTVNGNPMVINISDYDDDVTLTVQHSQNLGRNFLLTVDKDRGRIIPTSKVRYRNSETNPVTYTFSNSNNDSVSVILSKWGLTSLCSNTVGGYPPC